MSLAWRRSERLLALSDWLPIICAIHDEKVSQTSGVSP